MAVKGWGCREAAGGRGLRRGWKTVDEACLHDGCARTGSVLKRLEDVQICGKKQKLWDWF